MKCHYSYESGEKVLIPGCLSVAVSWDMERCTCDREYKTFEQFEKEEYNKNLNELQNQIKALEKEVSRLSRVIKNRNKPRKRPLSAK